MRKNRKPTFDNLESRQLMAAGYQSIAADTPAMYGMPGMPPMVPPAPTGQPGMSLIGGSPTSIGGSAGVSVTPGYMNQWAITKVVYSASGAIGSQTFGTSQGSFTAYTGYTANYPTADFPNGVQQSQANWFWNESVGEHTISVVATYNDPAKTTLSGELKVTTSKPVEDMTLTGRAYHVGPRDATDTYYGITSYGPLYQKGVLFNDTVSAVPSGGEFAFVQIITKADFTTESAFSTRKRITPAGSTFLDIADGQSTPNMNASQWKSLTVLPSSVPSAWDTPGIYVDISAGIPTANYQFSLSIDYAFDTYCVWHPSGGLYVAVNHISWSVNATAVFNGNLTDAGARARFKDPANWTFTTNHGQDWTQTGDHTTKLLTWTDNAPHGMPPVVTTPIP